MPVAGAGRPGVKQNVRLERALFLLALALALAWLTVEENSRLGAAVFGVPWAIWIAGRVRFPRAGPVASVILRSTVGGSCTGPLAIVLILLKVALHSHVSPDYQVEDVLAMLAWTPIGAGLGGMVGLGLALIRKALPRPPD
jgi:hypothetical protein